MRAHRHPDARAFMERAEDWLLRSEAEHNLLLGIAYQLRDGESRYEDPIYLATVEDEENVVGCALRTPPYQIALTELPLDTVEMLVRDVAGVYRSLPGVGGPEPQATRFAEEWSARTGGAWTVRFRMCIHVLEKVAFPTCPPTGSLRLAQAADKGLIREWGANFAHETGTGPTLAGLGERLVDQQCLYIWDDNGPRSMLATVRATPGGATVNYVYTPRNWRGQGYATIAVASLSQLLLDCGRRFCSLYTNLANPISNAIYARIGYKPIRDTVEINLS